MEKISLSIVIKISDRLAENKKSFFINPFYLLENCFFEEKGEDILVAQKSVYRENEFNYINVPNSVNIFTTKEQTFTLLFEEEVTKLKELGLKIIDKQEIGVEFFYKTSDFINLEGSKFSKTRKKINKLIKENEITVLDSYDKDKVIEFIKNWSKTKDTSIMAENEIKSFKRELKSNTTALELLDKLPNKSYFIEIKNKLVGFKINVPINNKYWASVFKKTDHTFKGLDELFYHISAKDFEKISIFTTGSAGRNDGLKEYKRNMHPIAEKILYFVRTEKI